VLLLNALFLSQTERPIVSGHSFSGIVLFRNSSSLRSVMIFRSCPLDMHISLSLRPCDLDLGFSHISILTIRSARYRSGPVGGVAQVILRVSSREIEGGNHAKMTRHRLKSRES
jgi:hypothetical protein